MHTSRKIWLDVAKGLGIFLLVVLHVEAVSSNNYAEWVVWTLKLFRMPMFFIVSGMLFRASPWVSFGKKKFISLMIPYASYVVLIFGLLLLRKIFIGIDSEYLSLKGVARIAIGGQYLTKEYGVYWFIPCLFISQMVYNFLVNRFGSEFSPYVVGAIVVILAASHIFHSFFPSAMTPLGLGTVPYALPFMWFGNVLTVNHAVLKRHWLACAIVVGVAVLFSLAGFEFDMDLKTASPGVPLISIALACALTWVFFQTVKILSKVPYIARIAAVLGEASIAIMFMHQFFHFTLREMGFDSDVIIIAISLILSLIFWRLVKNSRIGIRYFLGTRVKVVDKVSSPG